MRQVLVVDDDRAMVDLVGECLTSAGYVVHPFTDPQEALNFLRHHVVALVLTDVRMPRMSGIELCRQVHALHADVPVMVLTGFGSMETAVEAMRAGAYDFLPKPFELEVLEVAVARAVDHSHLKSEVQRLRAQIRPSSTHGLIGSSSAFSQVLHQIPKAARSDVSVLIQGETGTGKELVARALHRESSRSSHPFVAINCAAIPENLVESELFGHVKGAFTDASGPRAGLFSEAGEGTLFLDEVGELPLTMQPKLLRALQEHTVRPVGADREIPVRCRVLAATNLDMKAACADGRFRADLFYRLAVIRLALPPLRERAGDILEIARHFVETAATRIGVETPGLSTSAARVLLGYSWPGNVRELENAIERAVAMAEGDVLLPEDLPEELQQGTPTIPDVGLVSLPDLERAHIQRVLLATGGNKKAAAEILGLDRRTLYRKLERED